ncbi:MAG: BCSC C-terminal domain-containing protein [Alphaproteobacteria bacterium]|nr:BCSC C-terminal domain-containing protein [Alphaproteobacteria bacterium]
MAVWKWIWLTVLSATLISVAAAAPLRGDTEIEVRRLGVPALGIAVEQREPDTPSASGWTPATTVWSAANDQEWDKAEDQLTRLKQQAPEWTPPAELTRLIDQGLRQQAIAEAVRDERWADVLRLSPTDGLSCPSDAQFWAVSEAYAKTNREQLLQTGLMRALEDCTSSADEAQIIDRATTYLSLEGLRDISAGASLQSSNLAKLTTRIETLERSNAASDQDWARLAELARAHGVREATIQAAWGLLESDPAAARSEFEYALSTSFESEAEYGAALAAYRVGDHAPALALSLEGDDETYGSERAELAAYANLREAGALIEAGNYRRAEQRIDTARRLSTSVERNAVALSASISLARADEAYEDQDFEAAIALAQAAERAPEMREAARSRIAWSLFQRGNDEAAFDAFSALYQSTTSDAAADGLVLAASRAGWLDRLQPLATTRSGPLLNRLKTERARTALQRNNYLTAQQSSPIPLAELVGIDRPYVRQSVSIRANDGDAGEGRVRSQIARTSVGFTTGQTHLEIGAGIVDMSAGTGAAATRSSDERGVAPFIKLEREGDVSVSVQVSTTPTSGPVARTLTGALAVARDTSDGMRAEAAVFKRGVGESLTSTFGREDSATGETWGRVTETGVEASIAAPVSETISVQASASASQLDGENIQTNQSVKAGISAVKSFKVDRHAYLSAGPFYQFQAFDENTNFHSPEHGGYFSPQSYHRAGVGVFGQTEDLKTWMVRYEFAGAVEVTQTDAAAVRPRTAPNGAAFTGNSDTMLAGSARFEIARKLSEEWTLTAGASAIASSAFNEVQAGVALKFVPGGKARVSTRDLTPDLFSRDIL